MFMDTSKEIKLIRSLLDLTQEDLAKEIGVSFETINRWEMGKAEIEAYNKEKLYAYAYRRKVYLNKIYEQLFKEDESEEEKVLFHGSKKDFSFPVDLLHSKANNDFGRAFYLGENLNQASTYVANSPSPKVYAFKLNLSSLKRKRFDVSKEWMLSIAYYRGWLIDYRGHPTLKTIVSAVEEADIIIAPIADNRMFDLISEFVRGEITDLQATHALSATNLGMQYALRSLVAIKNLSFLDSLHISSLERESLVNERLEMNALGQDKVKVARINYRGKGRYIDELLK